MQNKIKKRFPLQERYTVNLGIRFRCRSRFHKRSKRNRKCEKRLLDT